MIPLLIFGLASLIYLVAAAVSVRSALVNGHRGDYTIPVTVAFMCIAVSIWIAAFVVLGDIRFDQIPR